LSWKSGDLPKPYYFKDDGKVLELLFKLEDFFLLVGDIPQGQNITLKEVCPRTLKRR